MQTLTNAAGCDSIATLVLTIATTTASIFDNNAGTLTASTGASYEWIDCISGAIIPGATQGVYTATVNGEYAVIVTLANGCSDTSECVLIDYLSLNEITGADIYVFPNPTNDQVTIQMSVMSVSVQITDAQGKRLSLQEVSNGDNVSLADYAPGVYFLRIGTSLGTIVKPVIRK
jgi:hypothetical protein